MAVVWRSRPRWCGLCRFVVLAGVLFRLCVPKKKLRVPAFPAGAFWRSRRLLLAAFCFLSCAQSCFVAGKTTILSQHRRYGRRFRRRFRNKESANRDTTVVHSCTHAFILACFVRCACVFSARAPCSARAPSVVRALPLASPCFVARFVLESANRDTTVVHSCTHAFLRALSGVCGSLACVLLYAVVHRKYIRLCITLHLRLPSRMATHNTP